MLAPSLHKYETTLLRKSRKRIFRDVAPCQAARQGDLLEKVVQNMYAPPASPPKKTCIEIQRGRTVIEEKEVLSYACTNSLHFW